MRQKIPKLITVLAWLAVLGGLFIERFIAERYAPAWASIGWKLQLLKGLRGDRPEKYVVLFEIDSLETLTRYEPAIGSWTAEGQAFLKANQALLDGWNSFVGGSLFTDYLVVGG